MLATDALREDHERLRALFLKVGDANTPSVAAEEGVFEELKAMIRVHARIEAEIFHAALREVVRDGEALSLLDEAGDDDREIEQELVELTELRPGDDEFESKLRDLREEVEAHLELEENKIFPLAERLLDEVDLERIAEDLDELKEDLLGPADIALAAELEEGMIARS